jgi:hypothetical protein
LTTGNFLPATNNTSGIGAFGNAIKDIYSSGTLRIGTGTTIDGTTLTLAAASGFNTGKFFVDASGNVNASGSLRVAGNVTSTGTIAPATNNTADLGAFGSAWRDVYASGTVNSNLISVRTTASNTLVSFYSQSSSTPNTYITTSGTITATGLNALLRIDAVTSTLPTTFNFIAANWGSGANGATNTAFSVRGDGQIFSDAGTTVTSPADLAELTKVDGPYSLYPDGTIVSQSLQNEEVAIVAVPEIGNVLGIATNRGVFMGSGRWGKEIQNFSGNIHAFEEAYGVRRVAVAGYVKVRVNDENGPIRPGDPLGLSRTTPGEARRAKQGDLIVGMARASFPPKPFVAPPGEGSPSATITETTEETITDSVSLTNDVFPIEEALKTATVDHGLVEAVVGNGAGLAIQQAALQNQGVAVTGSGEVQTSGIALLTNGPTTVDQLIVKDVASFHGELRVKAHVLFNEDIAGMAKFLPGSTTVHVTYAESYAVAPVVTVTPRTGVSAPVWVDNEDVHGFVIHLAAPDWEREITVAWHALAVLEPQLFVSDGTHGPADKEYLWRDDGSGLRNQTPPAPEVEGVSTEAPTPSAASQDVLLDTLSEEQTTSGTSEDAASSSDETPAAADTSPTGFLPDSGYLDGVGGPESESWIPFLPFTRG